jgi:ABC-type multidrug transport system permease subunit
MERLPFFLQVTSRFIPTTYVAAALREALTQPFSPLHWSSVAVITLFGVIGLAASVYKADWRVTASEAFNDSRFRW